jgi:hypothetical protein
VALGRVVSAGWFARDQILRFAQNDKGDGEAFGIDLLWFAIGMVGS